MLNSLVFTSDYRIFAASMINKIGRKNGRKLLLRYHQRSCYVNSKTLKLFENMENHENAISQYFAKKADEGMDMLCENGTITLDIIEKWGEEHMRVSRK